MKKTIGFIILGFVVVAIASVIIVIGNNKEAENEIAASTIETMASETIIAPETTIPETEVITEATTMPSTPQTEPQTEAQTEPETEPETDVQTEPETEPQTKAQSEAPIETQAPTPPETQNEGETDHWGENITQWKMEGDITHAQFDEFVSYATSQGFVLSDSVAYLMDYDLDKVGTIFPSFAIAWNEDVNTMLLMQVWIAPGGSGTDDSRVCHTINDVYEFFNLYKDR